MAESENSPLLNGNSSKQIKAYPRNYILPIVMVIFMCGEDMGSVATSQYIVKYFEELDMNSTTSVDSNGDENKSTDLKCDSNSTGAEENRVQKESANLMIYFQLIEYGVCIPVLISYGILSDVFGRKTFLVLSLFGNIVKYGSIAIVIYFNLSINLLYISYLGSSLSGTHYGFYMCYSASLADVTVSGRSRTFQLALMEYFKGIGLTVSQISAGYIIALWGYAIPNFIAFVIFVLSVILLLLFMEETLEISNRRQIKVRNCGQSLLNTFIVCREKGKLEKSKSAQYILVMAALLIFHLPSKAKSKIDILYLLGSPFCFSSESIGWFEAAKEFCHLNIGTGLLKVMLFCIRDEIIVILGCVSCIIYYCGMGLASKAWMLYSAVAGGIICLVPFPLLRAILSKMTSERSQGAVFANIYTTEAVSNLFSQSLFLEVYAETRPIFRGMVYLVFCVCIIVTIILLIPITIHNNRNRTGQEVDMKINNDENKE